MAPVIDRIAASHGIGSARRLESLNWHVSLLAIARFDEVFPQLRLDAIEQVCGSLASPGITVNHDRLMSFPASGACALLCTSDTDAAVRRLYATLAVALNRVGVRGKRSGQPHLTIFYDRTHAVAQTPLSPALIWRAADFSLVVSHRGSGYHQVLRSWPLGQ